MFTVFLTPVVIAALLQFYQYSGHLQNHGEWIQQPPPLNEVIHPVPHHDYSWSILVPCNPQCQPSQLQQIEHGISTLGVKANLVEIVPITPDMVYPHHRSLLAQEYFYLVTPQNELMFRYAQDNIMGMIFDLKKLLKPVEQRA